MRFQPIALLVLGLLSASPLALAQQSNTADASLVINGNSVGSAPLKALMGIQDPGLIAVDGMPGAGYLVLVDRAKRVAAVGPTGPGPLTQASSRVLARGTLDGTGHASVFYSPNEFAGVPLGTKFGLQALVQTANGSMVPSVATIVQFASTMSSMVTETPSAGSTARARGPMTSIGINTISVGNLQFIFTPETTWSGLLGPQSVNVGDWIVVDGRYGSGGALIVDEINIEDPEPMVRLKGPVQGVGMAGIVVLGRSVYTNSATTYTDLGVPANYADITVGMVVEVRVPLTTAEGFPQAASMNLNSPVESEPEPEPEPEPEIEIEIELPPPAPAFCS